MKGEVKCFNPSKIALLTAIFALAAGAQVFAQSSSDFSGLQRHVNKQVTVETQDGQVTGRLLRVEESRLVVYENAAPKAIARESVKRVMKHKSRHTAAWVASMSAAGLGAGFLLGMRAFDDAKNGGSKIGGSAGGGAGAGALAGYALSRIGNTDQVVYQQE
jgi:hypothetical protein